MTTLTLSASLGNYDLNHGLLRGEVRPQSVEIIPLVYSSPVRHWRMLRNQEFDICEMSMGSYFTIRGKGDDWITALPIFPRRRFRHSFIYVNAASGISSPADLEGRRVGLRTWQATTGVWAKGILADHYGVDLKSIAWFAEASEHVPVSPPGYTLEVLSPDEGLTDKLVAGDLDALIYPGIPSEIEVGDPRVRRLFPDYRTEEKRYFEATGIFPIMHTVVVRTELLQRHRWLAASLMAAFRESRDLGISRLYNARAQNLVWISEVIEDQRRLLGDNPWPYELEANREVLRTLGVYVQLQGLVDEVPDISGMFWPLTLEEPPGYG